MTTDTKAVPRWDHDSEDMYRYPDGDYVLFTDHERVVGEAYARIGEAQLQRDEFWDECVQLRTALAASRAEVEGLKKDAGRWRYTRRKLCLTGNGNGTCGMQAINLPESIPGWPEPGGVGEFCDSAIDAEMDKRA